MKRISKSSSPLAVLALLASLACQTAGMPSRSGSTASAGENSTAGVVDGPNVLFILLDDLGYGALGSYGSDFIHTPNIDRLAAEGMRFTRYYSAPVCSLARVALLMGNYPYRAGIRHNCNDAPTHGLIKGIPASLPTVTGLFDQAGYRVGHIGKWHVGEREAEFRPAAKGIDEAVIADPIGGRNWYHRVPLRRGERWHKVFKKRGHTTEILTGFSLRFLRRSVPREKAGAPFFLNLWYLAPHRPLDELPPRNGKRLRSRNVRQRDAYRILVENADEKIGVLLDYLDRTGLARNTIVILSSDNGSYAIADSAAKNAETPQPWARGESREYFNGPFRKGKGTFFEGGIRVPLIVRWPGMVEPGSTSDAPVGAVDFLPTFADILGVDASSVVSDGVSFLDILTSGGDAETDPRDLYWHYKSGERITQVAVTRKWKFIANSVFPDISGSAQKLLFDLESDPGEGSNLAERHPSVVAGFSREISRQRLEDGRIEFAVAEQSDNITSANGLLSFADGDASSTAAVLAPNTLINTSTDDFTFSAWIRMAPEDSRPDVYRVIAKKPESWNLFIDRDRYLTLELFDPELRKHKAIIQRELRPGEWYHVAFTLFKTWRERWIPSHFLSLRGLDERARTMESLPAAKHVAYNRRQVLLGRGARHGGAPFIGDMFDVRFYSVGLSPEEIEVVAKNGMPP